MRIPKGDFGLRAPGDAPRANVGAGAFVQPGMNDMGEGGLKVGAAMANEATQDAQLQAEERRQAELVAKAEQRQADAEARQLFRESKAAEARTLHATAANSLGEAHDQIVNDVMDGSISKEDAPRVWDERSKKITEDALAGVDKANTETVRAGLVGNVGHFGRQINQAVVTRSRQDIGTQLNATLEQLQRTAERDLPNAIALADMTLDSDGPKAGLNPEQIGKIKQQFRETATFNKFNNDLVGARRSMNSLTALENKISESQDLDPGKKNVLIGHTSQYRAQLAAAGERAAQSRERTLRSAIDARDMMTLKGFPTTPQQDAAMLAAAKGTPYEQVVQSQIDFGRQTNEFRVAPPVQRQDFINKFEAQLRANPSADGIKTLEQYKQLDKGLTKAQSEDIISFAAQNGVATIQPLDITKPTTLGDQLQARVSAWRGLRGRYGGTSGLLMESEVEGMKAMLDGMPPKPKAEMLKTIAEKISDPIAIQTTAAQINKHDKGLGTAMFLAGRDYRDSNGRSLAQIYLTGQDALTTKSAKIDEAKETGLRAELAEKLNGVYTTSTARDTAVDVAMKVWASGRVNNDGLDNINRAVNMATGGLMELNGGKLAKPYGWTDSRFRDGISAITPQALIARAGGAEQFQIGKDAVSAEKLAKMLPAARLQTVGDGQYAIIAGPDYVRLPNRKPLIIELR